MTIFTFISRILLFVTISLVLLACSDPNNKGKESKDDRVKVQTPNTPPEWSKHAVWYQIFVERFHNGDPSNDPTKLSIKGTYPGYIPESWAITPWTQDWYTADAYFDEVHNQADFSGNPVTSFDAKTALRRYGGDLQGVIDKLDYLAKLGINALYFNPINDAPSMHKYDARHWRHVDVNFGPDPAGDREIIAKENPTDPSTWKLTSADKLFVELIQEAKKRDMRIIMDYSWNHTGHTFWAWQDLLKNQQESEFADWYWVKQFDDPATPENEFEYRGWFGVFDLPEIKETVYVDHAQKVALVEGDIYSDRAKAHIFAVTQRWLDPNNDGDTSDGIDGFRLDVAAEVPLDFWRDYRKFVKTINPDAYLIGEIWWEQFPDDLFDPTPVLQGDVFDAVMNYRWYRVARRFFAEAPQAIAPSEFISQLEALTQNKDAEPNDGTINATKPTDTTVQGFDKSFEYAMMNMSASHDSPRLLTSFNNNNKYKFNAKASQNSSYNSNKYGPQALSKAKLFLAHQFTYIGAPQIWAGDEMGMWGSDDPHNRKPLIWPEYSFEKESSHPLSRHKSLDTVSFDADLHAYYQSLVKLRRANPVLSTGEITFDYYNDRRRLLSYMRLNPAAPEQMVYVVFNLSTKPQQITLPELLLQYTNWQVWHSDDIALNPRVPVETLPLNAKTAMIIVVNNPS